MSDNGMENQIAILARLDRARMCKCAEGTALKKLRPGMMRDWITAPLNCVSEVEWVAWVVSMMA